MVKLGSPFIKYSATNEDFVKTVNSKESTPTKKLSSFFPFITPGVTIRDYVKRKVFKATKEEVSHLLKSTSILNITGKPPATSDKDESKKSKKSKRLQAEINDERSLLSKKNGSNEEQIPSADQKHIEESLDNSSMEIANQNYPAIINVEPCIQIEEPAIKPAGNRRFSIVRMSKKSKSVKIMEDPTPSCSSSLNESKLRKRRKWLRNYKKPKVDVSSDQQAKVKPMKKSGKSEVDAKKKDEDAKAKPVKWSKRMKKFAVKTCRYLGYGAQMVSPMAPYTDIPMPVTLDSFQNIYSPYYTSNPYYSYSSCGSIYGYPMNHYGFSY